MKKVFDLSGYLNEEKSTIVIGEDTFEINDGFNDMLKIDALTKGYEGTPDAEFVRGFLSIALGDEASDKIIKMNLPTAAYMKIMDCIQQTYSDTDEKEEPSR